MLFKMIKKSLSASIAALVVLSTAAHADDYPSRQIEFIVPFGPGGSSDTYVRLLAPRISTLLKVPVVVVNRPGAGGVIAAQYALQSTDGYRIFAGSAGPLGSALVVGPKAPYALEDVTGVAQAMVNPLILIAKPGRFASLDAFIKEAREKPGSINIGSYGLRSGAHFYIEQLSQTLNVKLVHVPYDSGAKAMMAALSGEVDIAVVTAATGKSNINAGTLKALFVSTEQNIADLPGVDSIKVLGYPAAVVGMSEGIVTSSKVAADHVDILRKAFETVLTDPTVLAGIRTLGAEPAYLSGPAYGAVLRKDHDRLKAIASRVQME